MSDTSQTAQTCDLRGIREAVCVHTDKITDSCLAKDCIEDLRVYLTLDSQRALDGAASARARYVELMHVSVQVEPVPYNTGHYTNRELPEHHHRPCGLLQASRPVRRREPRQDLPEPRVRLPQQADHCELCLPDGRGRGR